MPIRCCSLAILWLGPIWIAGNSLAETTVSVEREWRVRGALAAFRDPEYVVSIRGLDKLVRLNALNYVTPEAVASPLNKNDPHNRYLVFPIRALGRMHATRYGESIAKVLEQSDDEDVVVESIAALAELKDRAYAPPSFPCSPKEVTELPMPQRGPWLE